MEGEEEMKKRYLRRILAMILSVLMIIGTVPTSVFAEGITKDAENKDETELVQNSEESVEKKVQDDKTEPIEGNTSGESDSKKQEEDNSALEESTPTEPEETVEQPTKDKTNDLENKTENEENEKTAEENKTENQPEEEIKKETEATSDTTESVEEKSSEELLEELPESVLLSMNETKYDSYDQFLAYYYLTYSPLDYYVNSEELPYQTYIKNSDKEFKKELAAWRLATLDAGKTVEYSTKEVEFYEVLIYDILYQEMAENTILKNSDTGIKALQSSLIKEFADLDYDIALDTKVTADNAGDLLNKMLKLEEVQFLSGNVETIQKGIEYTKNVEEVLRKLAMIIQLQKSSEEIGTILKNLSQSATDERMKKACEKVANIASGTMSDAEILGIFTGEIAAKELATYTLGKVWDTLANSSYLGRFIKAGQEVGKLTSNILFSTDEIVETWYSMEQIVKFDGVLKKELLYYQKCFENNPSEANAKLFNQAADMYLNTVSVGVEYATKYVEAVKGKGVLGWIYKNLTHKDDYNKVIEQLNSIKNSVDQAIEFANNKTYDFYLEDMQTVVKIPWEKTGCEITKEEIDKTTSEMPEIVFELTDQNVKQNTTYSEDKLTYGDFTLNGGTLNLDEKALTVYGDFYLESGKLDIHKGSLNIKGNLYMRGGTIDLNRGSITVEGNVYWYNQDEKERYTSSSASLIMEDQVEVFDIRGDLITYLNWSSGYNCSAGTMKLGGNWTNYNHERSISGSNTFKLELDGTKDVTIDGSPSIYVPNMEVKNSDSRKVNLQGTIAIGCVIGDAKVVAKDTPSLRFGSATGKIEVTGNMQTYGEVKVGKSFVVHGDLYMREGTLNLNGGNLKVEGNAYLCKQDSKGNYTSMASNSGDLIMENKEDILDVRGNLITYFYHSSYFQCSAGTLKLGGNWTNYENISGSGNFKVEADETAGINGVESIYVPNLEVKSTDSKAVTLKGTVGTGCVIGDAKVVAKDTPSLRFGSATGKIEVTGNMQTYGEVKVGKSFVVHGDLYMREGTLNLNGGNLKVEGNAYLCKQDSKGNYTSMASNSGDLIMENKEDILDVRGNLITYFYHSSYFQCSAGTLKLGGNWTNYENISGSGNFKVEADETAGINGVESIYVPNLEVKSTDSKAVTLKGTVETGCVIGDAKVVAKDTPYLRFGSATGKIEVTGNMWTYGEVKVGKSFVVHGDLHMKGGNLNLNGGNLTVEGNAYFCSQDSKGNYTSMSDSAHLVMENKEDTLDVRGDLVTYFGYSGYFQCSAGTLKLGGNWTNYKYISGSGSFKVEADETAGINGVESIYVPNLKVKSTDSKAVTLKGKVNIDALSDGDIRLATEGTPTINIGTVTGDLEIDGNAKLTVSKVTGNITVGGNLYSTGFVMGAHTLNVGGNFYLNTSNTVIFGKSGSLNVQGDVWMSDGTLSLGGKTDISGTVYQSGGLINVNGGILKIAKDYRIQDTDNSTGELEWVKSYGRLKMTNKKDCVLVGGNFYNQSYYSSELSAGTLVILGDFYQIGESGNFYPSGTHAVLLAGKKNQKVSFEATGCKFNILQLRRTSSYYLFEPDGCWSRLEQKVEVPEWVGYKEPEKLASGYCGSNLTWILTDDGVLKFSGEGNMRNYSSAKATSWYAYRDKIVSIELEPEITSIGEFAFSDLPKLKEIASWDGITSVGDYAFKNSTALENVVLPSKMKKLGGSAFYGCTELKSVSIPEGVYTVWGYTFKNCTSLKEVKLPSTLVKIDEAAFYGCKSITKMKIPESVSIIGIYCFKNCSNLSSVTLSDNMTQIREAAFYGTALKEIKIPDNVTVIGSYAFKNCIALEKVQFSKKLTKIDDSAFYACQSLTSLVIPENVTTINSYAFRKCTGLQSVTFPQSLKTIGESAFYGCSDLKELKIPEGVEALGGYSFKGCVVAQTITLPSTLKNIGESAFYGCSQISEIIIPENVETLGAYTFSQCTELKTVKFAGNAPVIGAYAFARVTAKVSYPSGNTTWNKEKQQNYGGTLTWSEAK